MASKEMSISEKLWDSLDNDVCDLNEVAQLMSLDEQELCDRFASDASLRQRYLNEPIESSFVVETQEYSEPETETSEEEETPKYHVRMERGESSGIKQESRPESRDGYRSDSSRKRKPGGKAFYIPPTHKGIPNSTGRSTEINTINLDCIPSFESRRTIIDRWINEISLIVQTNPDSFSNARKVLTLLEHKSEGNAKAFIKQASWELDMDPYDIVQEVGKGFYTMFLGLDYVLASLEEEQKREQEAKDLLIKSQICNICELDNFTCFYETQLSKLSMTELPKWIELYLGKIPIIGSKARERWHKEKSITTEYSLAYAKRLVLEETSIYCDFQKVSKKLKAFSKKCCAKNDLQTNTMFGCTVEVKKKKSSKKRFSKEKSKKKVFKKYWKKKKKKFSPGKYFSKKKFENKTCPQGKKKCRCWICSEEGHYANECPNRKQYPEKLKLLLHGISEGYYPLEDAYTGNLEVYSMQVIEDTSEESSSSDESSSSSSDDE